ncbi:MAG: RDD family protein [Aquaticitalea sp.]
MGIFRNYDLERAVALVIDSFFVNFLYNVIITQSFFSGLNEINYNFLLLTFLLYFIFFDIFNSGQTLGKIFLNVKVVEHLSLKMRISRSFLKIISIYITPVTIIIYLFKKKILHDILFNSNEVIHN